MSRDQRKAVREDLYGPSYDVLFLGLSFGALVLCIGEFVIAYFVGASSLLLAVFGAFIVSLAAYAIAAIRRRRLVRQTFLQGRLISAIVVKKQEEILGIPVGGGNVRYWVTLSYEMNGPREIRRRVTDRVYLRSQEGELMPVRVLPEHPDLWVPMLER